MKKSTIKIVKTPRTAVLVITTGKEIWSYPAIQAGPECDCILRLRFTDSETKKRGSFDIGIVRHCVRGDRGKDCEMILEGTLTEAELGVIRDRAHKSVGCMIQRSWGRRNADAVETRNAAIAELCAIPECG